MIDFASASSLTQTFQFAEARKISKLIFYEKNVISTPLTFSMDYLTEVTFEGTIASSISFAWSPLNRASILSCFSVLSDTATGKTATFKQTAVDTAFETSQGAADGSTSPEWLALVDTKSNWTISLV